MDPTELGIPEGRRIFIKEKSLCGFNRGPWKKCKNIKGNDKLTVSFVSNGTIKVKILENDPVKPATHAADLKKMFSNLDIGNLQFVCREQLLELIFLIR